MISFELVSIRFAILFLYFISHHQVQAGEYRQKLFLQLRNIIYLADCSVTRTRGPQIHSFFFFIRICFIRISRLKFAKF